MIRAISILQMSLPGYMHWPIVLCNRPVRGFFLRFEGLHLLTADDDGMVDSSGMRIRSQRTMLDICGSHEILSLNISRPEGFYSAPR
jgi:hypothetical protein